MTTTSVHAGRWPLSRLASARARTLAALVYAASEESPAARTPTSELDQREIVARGLLIASRDGSKSFESVEEDLDEIAFAIKRPIQEALSAIEPIDCPSAHGDARVFLITCC